jgi:DNA-binding NarL/FixJ family response regulator
LLTTSHPRPRWPVDRHRPVLREGPLSTCLVYDDRRHARALLARLLAEVPGVRRVVAVASVEALTLSHAHDGGQVVFVGTRLAGASGVDAIRHVLTRRPDAVVVAVGAREDAPTIGVALAAGALGFLRWDASPSLAFTLIQSLTGPSSARLSRPGGGCAGCEHPGHRAAQRELGISRREMQVLDGISRGLGNAGLSRELDLSENTVKSHVRRVFRRLGVHERAHAVARAHRFGLFACPDGWPSRDEELAGGPGTAPAPAPRLVDRQV